MNLAHASSEDYVIRYRLRQDVSHIRLRVWEPPAVPDTHRPPDQPYLYAINYSFAHLREAEAFLRQHLLVNGAFDVPEADFPEEGEIAILPFPTWGMESDNGVLSPP